MKNLFWYFLGAAMGASTGYLIGDYIANKIENDRIEKALALAEGGEGETPAPQNEEVNASVITMYNHDIETSEPIGQATKVEKTADTLTAEVEKKDYTKFYKGSKTKATIDEVAKKYLETPEEIAVKELPPPTDHPYIIDVEKLADPDNSHCKTLWTYYTEDDTMANEQEEIVPNPQDILGDNFRSQFGVGSGDPDMVFIRNNKLGYDYEVTRVQKKYSVVVAGVSEEPPKKQEKPVRRRGGGSTRKVKQFDDEDED